MSKIRLANINDLEVIKSIYILARKIMRKNNNLTQWDNNYPDSELLINDIAKRQLYVIIEKKNIHACFVLTEIPNQNYQKIKGKWSKNITYASLQRVASDGILKGIFKKILIYSNNKYSYIKIDTNPNNYIMKNILEKNNFNYCGIINIDNGREHLAYDYFKKNYKNMFFKMIQFLIKLFNNNEIIFQPFYY